MIVLRFLAWFFCAGLILLAWIFIGAVFEVVGLTFMAHRVLPFALAGLGLWLFVKIVPE